MFTLTAASLRSKFFDWGLSENEADIVLPGDIYVIPKSFQDWIASEFSWKLLPWLAEAFPDGYDVSGPSVCIDYAVEASVFAQRCWRNTPGRVPGRLAFGVFPYTMADGGRHCRNIFIDCDGERFFPGHYEPQTQKIVNLNPQEFASCKQLVLGC